MPDAKEQDISAGLPIGVFDSGLGGLTVFGEIRKMLPAESIIYLGDTARTPYGSKGAGTVVRYGRECMRYLVQRRIKLLVVACNTVSSLALELLESECPVPVIGTIAPAVRAALEETCCGRIGIIGTEATIASGAYQRALHQARPEAKISAQPCPLFVPLVEQGLLSGAIVDQVIDLYLADFKNCGIDVLILGCTHYPLLAPALQNYLGKSVKIVECSRAVAQEVQQRLQQMQVLSARPLQRDHYFVTDEVLRFNRLAELFLGGEKVEAVMLENLEMCEGKNI